MFDLQTIKDRNIEACKKTSIAETKRMVQSARQAIEIGDNETAKGLLSKVMDRLDGKVSKADPADAIIEAIYQASEACPDSREWWHDRGDSPPIIARVRGAVVECLVDIGE
jgi:hypothetical protein